MRARNHDLPHRATPREQRGLNRAPPRVHALRHGDLTMARADSRAGSCGLPVESALDRRDCQGDAVLRWERQGVIGTAVGRRTTNQRSCGEATPLRISQPHSTHTQHKTAAKRPSQRTIAANKPHVASQHHCQAHPQPRLQRPTGLGFLGTALLHSSQQPVHEEAGNAGGPLDASREQVDLKAAHQSPAPRSGRCRATAAASPNAAPAQ